MTDWAHWDDTYQFIQNKNQKYIRDNLESLTLYKDIGVNFVLFFDNNYQYIYGSGYDLQKNKFISVPESLITQIIKRKKTILKHDQIRNHANGFIRIPEGYLLISSFPVTDSQAAVNPNGNIVMAYYFDENRIKQLSKTLGVNINLITFTEILNDSLFVPIDELNKGLNYYAVFRNNKMIDLFMYIRDIVNTPIGLLHIEMPRKTYQQGLSTIRDYLVISGIIGVLILIVFQFVLKKLILDRISAYKKQLGYVIATHDFSQSIKIKGDDEIASMAISSNALLQVINHAKSQLENTIIRLKEKKYTVK